MLNQSVNLKMNTPATGIIQRSSDKSFFVRCHQTSPLSDSLFNSDPIYNRKSISVLQVMLMNENYILVEIMYND